MTIARTLAAATLFVLAVAAPAAATQSQSASAVVDPDGTLVRGQAVTSASHVATGSYLVTFDYGKTADSCAFTASIGLSGTSGISPPGLVNVAAVSGGTVSVLTYDTHGNAADLGFHIYVACDAV